MPMRNKIVIFSLFIITAILLIIPNFFYPSPWLEKIVYTVVVFGIIYLIFEILLEEAVLKKIKVSTTKYSSKKTLSVLSFTSYALAFLIVWIAETQYILLSLGLIGAAIAFALQDVFKNFAGGIMIFLNGIYHVGDRIEFNERYGDVIDIGILYTTLMEIREWVQGDQVTGRLTMVPNGGILSGTIQNYTRDFDFIWDELTIPITYDSDWKEANSMIIEIARKETLPIVEKAEKTMNQLEGKYYFTKRSIEPSVFITLTDNWISFGVRYVAEVHNRRVLHDKLSRAILEEIGKSDRVKIASATINITSFPTVSLVTERKDRGPSKQD
jgi:small-conductance mechanosensitive channel